MSWIAGWNKRIKLTISGSCIEGDLSNFPVMVHLDSTCSGVFNELGSNSKRISVVNSEQSQCYVEVERWDESTNNAWLWVNVTTLSSGVSSDLYLYYDNLRPDNSSYVGTVGEVSAQNVWDDNFVGVWHMSQDPSTGGVCIKDSTVNVNHGTPAGSMTVGDLVDGKVGKALDFDGVDDIIKCGGESLVPSTGYTFEGIINVSSSLAHSSYIAINQRSGDTALANLLWLFYDAPNLYMELTCLTTGVSRVGVYATDIDRNTLVGVAGVYKGDQTSPLVYRNGVDVTATKTDGDGSDVTDDTGYICVGGRSYDNNRNIQALVDETRVSNIDRSAPWIKATYYSNWNQLINYGTEETVSSGILPGWNNRLKLTIQSDYIDNDLIDFPVMIKLSEDSGYNSFDSRSVFYELTDNINRKKIAITDSTGILQCFVEIERFSCPETDAVLWTKLPIIYSSIGTHFYLYYDKTQPDNTAFVGDVNSIVAQNVWDDNFVGVWHMNQDPTGGSDCIKDSTGTVHGTPVGSMTSGDLVDGKIGKALDFDGNADGIILPTSDGLYGLDAITVEGIVKCTGIPTTWPDYRAILYSTTDQGAAKGFSFWLDNNSNAKKITIQNRESGGGAVDTANSVWSDDETFNLVMTHVANTSQEIWKNGVSLKSATNSWDFQKGTIAPVIGYEETGATDSYYFKGLLDEIRISNIARSASWIKATYYSNWDSLIVFEKESITPLWLDDWAHRIKLTIDHTKIDSSLTDFPVLVTLTSGVQSDFFSELSSLGYMDDTFTDNDYAVPDSDLWTRYANNNGVLPHIMSNKLKLHITSGGNDGSSYCDSKYRLGDDFSIQIDYELPLGSFSVQGGGLNLKIYTTGYSAELRRIRDGLGNRYHFSINGGNVASVATSDVSGKLKYVRTGSSLSAFFWGGSSWTYLGAGTFSTSIITTTRLRAWNYSSHPEIDIRVDNFIVNYGAIFDSNSKSFNRKKIALTTNNGTTQCPVEIEQWDFYAGKVNLWTKIPTVVFDNDTDIYLYYDISKDDNDSYVGDVDSTSARNVWDDNFVGVWHMCQDPTGGVGCIKDSTGNNNGTPGGSMASGDLVEGKIGKALDFDGNGYINAGNVVDVTTGSITLEGIIKTSASAAQVIFQKANDITATDPGYVLYLRTSDPYVRMVVCDGTNYAHQASSPTNIQTGVLFYIVGIWNASTHVVSSYVNFSLEGETTNTNVGSLTNSCDFEIGRNYNAGSPSTYVDGILDETRISNIVRSVPWIKATYYSNWNTLLTQSSVQNYTPPPDYYYHGYVKEEGIYVSRKLYLYRRDTGAFIDSCMSNAGTGYYLLETTISGEHFVVALDDDAGDTYNALIQDRLYPNDM